MIRTDLLKKLIFSLNDGLQISNLKINGNETPFLREKHLVIVSDKLDFNPGEEIKVQFTYAGKINEALCYLDIEEEVIQEKYGKFVINVDKRYAFITPDYLLLTPEANWYPKTGVTYSSANIAWYQPQFIDFNLEVITREGLKAISQGEIKEISAGQFTFENKHALTQISLAVGNYKQKILQGKDVEFGVWYLDGHDYFTDSFEEINDTLSNVINERFDDFKRTYKLNYLSDKLSLVEVPAQFKTFKRAWASTQEYVQPRTDFNTRKRFYDQSIRF
jgi:hypothetical protein